MLADTNLVAFRGASRGSAIGQTVTCTTDGSVAVGEVITARIQVRVTATGGQQIVNTATVIATSTPFLPPAAGDPVIANNDDSVSATVTTSPIPTTGARIPTTGARIPTTGARIPTTRATMIHAWTQAALGLIAVGLFALIAARRRRFTGTR